MTDENFKDFMCLNLFVQTSTKLVPGEIDKMITYGRIYKMKKLLGIVIFWQ